MSYLDNCTCEEDYTPEHVYKFTGPCAITGKPHTVVLSAEGLYRYNNGAFVQDAFPKLTSEDREFVISGVTPEGWKKTIRRRR